MTTPTTPRELAAKRLLAQLEREEKSIICDPGRMEMIQASRQLLDALAEPPAPAHADHDALASFQQWLMQVEALDVRHDLGLQPKELGDGIRSALVHVRLEVDRRLARPRAVPDAGALLLRPAVMPVEPGLPRSSGLCSECGGSGQVSCYNDRGDVMKCPECWKPLGGAPQPQPQREGCTCDSCGVEFLDDVNIDDVAWAGIHPRAPGGLLCGACIVRRLAGVPAGLNGAPQPAPEEPMRESTEQEWLDAHGEHRREQAQASEAAKRWRERVCLWTNTGGKSDPLTLGELLDEAVEHWDAGALSMFVRERDALRKENEELREEIEDANRVLIQQDNGLIDDGLSHGGLVRTVVTRLDDKLNEAECDRDALRKENEELRAKLEAIKKAL